MPRKILHVIGKMDRAGVETWLMHMMRNLDKDQFEIHFLVHDPAAGAYDQEILALGGHIHRGPNPRRPLQYRRRFRRLVTKYGPFDVLHSHVYWYSGFILRVGHSLGIPVRIAQSHTARNIPSWNVPRWIYGSLMRKWILRHATHRIGISLDAGKALFGSARAQHPGFTLLHYGFDFRPFFRRPVLEAMKQSLGIEPERKVIGQVGRFVALKNHAFTLEVFKRVLAGGIDAHLLFVGDGPLLADVRAQVESSGLAGRCTFAGAQSDVSSFLFSTDVLLVPSEWEGLGIVALEAQAAGVPVVASTGVPCEVDVIPGLIEHIPLDGGAQTWAAAVTRRLQQGKQARGDEALALQNSSFGLPACLRTLSHIYLEEPLSMGANS
ncbi:MAG TPA: glycosyltransferase [Terriglobales bacterium]